MELRSLMVPAAEITLDAVRQVAPERFGAPTPCPEFAVRDLLGHLAGWTGERARAAAVKRPLTDAPDDERDLDLDAYASQARAAAEAWSDESAWEGKTGLSGQMEMPASLVGGLLYSELLLHAWDLSAAVGRDLPLDDAMADALLAQVSAMADMARQYKAFGPEVNVPSSASPLHRALGLAGRDPEWSP